MYDNEAKSKQTHDAQDRICLPLKESRNERVSAEGETPSHPLVNKGSVSGTRVRKRANQLFSLRNALVHMHRHVRPASLFPRTRCTACTQVEMETWMYREYAQLDKEIPALSRKFARDARANYNKNLQPLITAAEIAFPRVRRMRSVGARRSVRYAPKSRATGFTGVIFFAATARCFCHGFTCTAFILELSRARDSSRIEISLSHWPREFRRTWKVIRASTELEWIK